MDIISSRVPTIADFPIPLGYPDHESYYFYNPNDQEVYDAYDMFRFFNIYFFHNILEASEVKWSARMTLCAGTCQLQSPGSCLITLSKPLLQFRTNNELKETLVHEMIHGYLFITNPKACREQGGHGKEFCEIMNNINSITGLNITVYHSFHDEVDYFRKHIWKCNGPCQQQKPYYGLVKRAMNRAPGPKDYWWKRHEQNCGGQFTKIEGPEFHPEEKAKKEPKNKKRKPTVQANDLNAYLKRTKTSENNIPRVYLYLLSDDEDNEQEEKKNVFEDFDHRVKPDNHEYSNNSSNSAKANRNEESKEDLQKKLDYFTFKKDKPVEKKTGTLFDFMNKVPSSKKDSQPQTKNQDSFLFSETPEKPQKKQDPQFDKSPAPTSGKSSQSKSHENKIIYSIFVKKDNCKNDEKFWLRILINSELSLENLLNIVDLICLPNAKSNRSIFVAEKQIVFFNKSLLDLDLSENTQLDDVTNQVQFKLEKIFFLSEVKNVNIMKAKHFPVCIGASFFKLDGSPENDVQERIDNINEMLISMF